MMNERIKLLAEQAEQYADDTMNADPATYDTPGQMKVWQELMQEKFAELIVRECMEVANTYQNVGGNCYVDDMIAKHFGVEE
jgi:hypothetical protein